MMARQDLHVSVVENHDDVFKSLSSMLPILARPEAFDKLVSSMIAFVLLGVVIHQSPFDNENS